MNVGKETEMLLLGVDTCGPSGSVALGRATAAGVSILGERELAGRSYSAMLVMSIQELLESAGISLRQLSAIVAVNGPGSFTGVRVGLSAVKGLAEAEPTRVLAVSRLEVLASKAATSSAALDAHRQEVFLRLDGRELLAGHEELAAETPNQPIAVCDDAAEALLRSVWPQASLLRVDAPTATDALRLCAPRAAAGQYIDLALLDANYLRRSDAEIFGNPAGK